MPLGPSRAPAVGSTSPAGGWEEVRTPGTRAGAGVRQPRQVHRSNCRDSCLQLQAWKMPAHPRYHRKEEISQPAILFSAQTLRLSKHDHRPLSPSLFLSLLDRDKVKAGHSTARLGLAPRPLHCPASAPCLLPARCPCYWDRYAVQLECQSWLLLVFPQFPTAPLATSPAHVVSRIYGAQHLCLWELTSG